MNLAARGQAFLALVVLIGGIVIIIGTTLAFLANSFTNVGYGYRAAIQAEAVAASGAQDALLRLVRNVDFSNASGYRVAVGSSAATVTVTQGSPSAGFATVLSTATVGNRTKKISVVVVVDTAKNQANVISWQATQ